MQVTNCRTRGWEKFDPIVNNRSLSQGIEHLMLYEFGYGGFITVLEKCKVSVRTSVMSCVDDTVFEWEKEESAVMLDIISTYVAVKEKFSEDKTQDVLNDRVMAVTGGNPLKIKLCSGVITGNPPVRATLMQLIGSEKHLDQLRKLNTKDLFTVFDLVYLEKQNIDEVMGLIG